MSRIAAAVALAAGFALIPPTNAHAGGCGQPLSSGGAPTASDALFVLRAAVGAQSCELAVCDVDSSCSITATDALRTLNVAVGAPLELDCTSCGITTTSTTTSTLAAAATWTDVYAIIQTASCGQMACHGAGFSSGELGGMDGFDTAYASLVAVSSSQVPALQRVAPFDPDASYLINKLEGTQLDVGGTGLQMPILPPLLTAEQIAVFRSWIASGAALSQ